MQDSVNININQISSEGLTLEEKIEPASLDLDTDTVKFKKAIKVTAGITKITNVVTVNLTLSGSAQMNCSRCLNDFEVDFKKDLRLSYLVDKSKPVIDLNPDIRGEVILDYPMKPLCNPDCKGLCPKCGKNLNEGNCSCSNV